MRISCGSKEDAKRRGLMIGTAVSVTSGILKESAAKAVDISLPPVTSAEMKKDPRTGEIAFSDAEWRRRLTRDQYKILRQGGTERPFTSPFYTEKRVGTFLCAGCNSPLFKSSTKFNSGTGWPSFYEPITENGVSSVREVPKIPDLPFIPPYSEVRCRKCEGHLGDVFNDGPQPTGLRYCIDGFAMTFEPAEEGSING